MNFENLTIKEAREIAAMFAGMQGNNAHVSPVIGKHCVVRTYSAGVFLGTVLSKDETNVVLENARRLWKWQGAFTLSEVATAGVKSGSRIAVEVPLIELTQAIELIPTTEAARATFEGIRE